ncbi:hypothetical protein [Flavobacterium columnare]|uniref:hypothetical protein n=1 Tax=Flavobacterium columnare TaxID=996 RepID=UPI0040342164
MGLSSFLFLESSKAFCLASFISSKMVEPSLGLFFCLPSRIVLFFVPAHDSNVRVCLSGGITIFERLNKNNSDMTITPLLKDSVLNCLCDSLSFESVYSIDLQSFFRETETDFNSLHAILAQFERLGFISDLNMRRDSLSLALHIESLDYKNRGGFFAQEEILKLTLEKLVLELDNLSKEFPDKVSTFTSIASNLATCAGLITLGQ